jgi:hypothetical protein
MGGVVLNVLDIFMGHQVVDAFVDMVADVPQQEVAAEIIIWVLIDLLVIAIVRYMSPATLVSAPTTGIMIAWGAMIVITVIPFSSVN